MPDDEPALAADLIRTARATLLAVEELRSDLHALAARVVALGEQVAAGAPDPSAVEAAVDARAAELVRAIATADANGPGRVHLGDAHDKYAIVAEDGGPPCLELLPICQARCCTLSFALSSQDLDEGVVRWDHGQPYLIRQDATGRCVHQRDHACGCYAQRPAPCRAFDCRADPRIWRDYAAREPAPPIVATVADSPAERRATEAARAHGLLLESLSLRPRR